MKCLFMKFPAKSDKCLLYLRSSKNKGRGFTSLGFKEAMKQSPVVVMKSPGIFFPYFFLQPIRHFSDL